MFKIKQWILNIGFIKNEIIKQGDICSKWVDDEKELLYQKSFNDARADLEETRINDIEEKAEELSKKKLNEMLSNVDLNQIVKIDKIKRIVFIGDKMADEVQLKNLKAEADFLAESSIWKLINETPKELAQRQMFVSGETLADLQKGKSILYALDIQNNIVNTFKSYQPKNK